MDTKFSILHNVIEIIINLYLDPILIFPAHLSIIQLTFFKMAPTVLYNVAIPPRDENKTKWFTGQVYVNNHDVCTDPSDPWRHCALLMEVWEKYDGVPSVCFIENDGCPDHNYRHLKPLLAMICLGLTAGVRVLVLNQNVAKQSFLNLVEKVMSLRLPKNKN